MSREEIAAMLNRVIFEHDLALKEVAYRIGRSVSTVQRIRFKESNDQWGRVSDKTLFKVATTFSTNGAAVKVDMNG